MTGIVTRPDGTADTDGNRATAAMFQRVVESRTERDWLTWADLARSALYDAFATRDLARLHEKVIEIERLANAWATDISQRRATGQTDALPRPEDAKLTKVATDARMARERAQAEAEAHGKPLADHLFVQSTYLDRCGHEVTGSQLCWRLPAEHPEEV